MFNSVRRWCIVHKLLHFFVLNSSPSITLQLISINDSKFKIFMDFWLFSEFSLSLFFVSSLTFELLLLKVVSPSLTGVPIPKEFLLPLRAYRGRNNASNKSTSPYSD